MKVVLVLKWVPTEYQYKRKIYFTIYNIMNPHNLLFNKNKYLFSCFPNSKLASNNLYLRLKKFFFLMKLSLIHSYTIILH